MIARSLLWDFFGRISNQLVTFIISVVLARILTPEDFGLVGMILVICTILQAYLDIGFSAALIQNQNIDKKTFDSVFVVNVVLGFFLSIGLYFSSDFIANFYSSPELVKINQTLSPIIFLGSFSVIFQVDCRKNMNFKRLANISILSNLASGVIGIIMALRGHGVWSIVAQQVTQRVAYSILHALLSKYKPKFQFDIENIKPLWEFSSKKIITEMIRAIVLRLDQILIGRLFSPATLGFYSRSKALNDLVVNNASGSLTSVLFSYLSTQQDNKTEFKSSFLKSMRLAGLISIVLGGLLFLNASEIFTIIFTDKWSQSAIYFMFLICSDGITRPINGIAENALLSMGLAQTELKILLIKRLVWVIPLTLMWFQGIDVFLYALVVYSYFVLILSAFFVKKHLGISIKEQLQSFTINLISVSFIIYAIQLVPSFESDFMGILIKSTIFILAFLVITITIQHTMIKEVYQTLKGLWPKNS